MRKYGSAYHLQQYWLNTLKSPNATNVFLLLYQFSSYLHQLSHPECGNSTFLGNIGETVFHMRFINPKDDHSLRNCHRENQQVDHHLRNNPSKLNVGHHMRNCHHENQIFTIILETATMKTKFLPSFEEPATMKTKS